MKKLFCIALSFLMIFTAMPITALANNSDCIGPNTLGNAYIKAFDECGENTESIIYSCREEAEDFSYQGISYDIESNTLNLNGCNIPALVIRANEMGRDFKINVTGENYLKRISLSGNGYNCSLSVNGNGSLYLGKNNADGSGAIVLNCDYTESTLTVSDTVSMFAYSAWGEATICVYNSLADDAIEMKGNLPDINYDSYETTMTPTVYGSTPLNTQFYNLSDGSVATYDYDVKTDAYILHKYNIVNVDIEGKETQIAVEQKDELGNPILVDESQVNFDDTRYAYLLLFDNSPSIVYLNRNDSERYIVSSCYDSNSGTDIYDIKKIVDLGEYGLVYYPVETGVSSLSSDYYIQKISCNSKNYNIFDSYSNVYGIVQRFFSAHVKDQDINYRCWETIYVEKNTPTYISFDVIDSWRKVYDIDWDISGLVNAGFTVSPEPVYFDGDDTAYLEVNVNDWPEGTCGSIAINCYNNEANISNVTGSKSPEPLCTYYVYVQVTNPVHGYAQDKVSYKVYEAGSTIKMAPNDTMMLNFYTDNYRGAAVFDWETESINSTGITVGAERYEESNRTYCKISSENCEVGTKGTLVFNLKRGEDYDYNNRELDKIAPLYTFEINFEVVTQCEAKGHNPDTENGTFLKKPTCKDFGLMECICTVCGETFITEIDPLPHGKLNKVERNRVEPTCTKTGGYEVAYICELCGDAVMGEYIELNPTGHKYDAGKVTKAATCKAKGVKTYTCTLCGAKKTESISIIAHKYTTVTTRATTSKDGKKVTKCSACGYVSKTVPIYQIKTISLSPTSYYYDGKVKTPTVTIKDRKGNTLKKDRDYSLSYASGRKYAGRYAIKITFKGNFYGTVTKTFDIKPKNSYITKLTATSKGFKVYWKKQSTQTSGFQIQYATDSKFTKNCKSAFSSGGSTTYKSIGKLYGKKRYYVRIRSYKTVKYGGKNINIYSGWSNYKYVTTKR